MREAHSLLYHSTQGSRAFLGPVSRVMKKVKSVTIAVKRPNVPHTVDYSIRFESQLDRKIDFQAISNASLVTSNADSGGLKRCVVHRVEWQGWCRIQVSGRRSAR